MDFGPMAKFFLFVFTVLLSLSLGLFVGQNYFIDSKATKTSESSTFDTSTLSFNLDLKTGFKEKFNFVMDKIFAQDKIKSSDSVNAKDSDENSADTFNESNKNMETGNTSNNESKNEKVTQQIKDLHQGFGVDLETSESVADETKAKSETSSTQAESHVVKTIKTKPVSGLKISAPDETKTGSSLTGWVIQVGAFQEETDALKVEQQVKESKFPFYYYKTEIKGKTWYRVNVGPFQNLNEATNFKQSKKVHDKFKGAFVRKL